eukprot:1625474-Ditylum_brightwellii.AAC.1
MESGLVVDNAVVTLSAGLVVSSGITTTGAINCGHVATTGVTSSGMVTANGIDNTSDRRFKKDIRPIEDPLGIINNLNGKVYSWRREEFPGRNFDDRPHFGFIAQEVEEVLPDVVGGDDK